MLLLINKYKPSYYETCKDLVKHSIGYSISLFSLWYYRDSYLSMITIPLLGLMNVRTFIIFHDCGHNSYTPSKKLNYVIGSILGIFVFTPFCWSYSHHNHHLTAGNKENKLNYLQNETVLYTFAEYRDMKYKRHVYRIIMKPLIFFTLIPSIKFFILNRGSEILYKYQNKLPQRKMTLILFDTLLNNSGLLLLLVCMNQYGLLYYYLCSCMCAHPIGFMLFHNQHTFNPPYVVTDKRWNKKDSGLQGSSFIQIPPYLKYFTSGIEYHHIHHMNASVPGYNMQKLHEEITKNTDELDNITRLSMRDCYHNLRYSLYDEENNKYISFAEAELKIKNQYHEKIM